MQLRINKLIHSQNSHQGLFSRCLGIILSLSIAAQPAHAKDWKNNGPYILLVGTIHRLNAAMQSAAENPMDKFRRAEVAAAMQAMPISVMLLAKEFQSNRLVDADLAPVLATLGGFVDKNAADRYKKFLKNPSADLIPKTGKGFPANSAAPKNYAGAGETSEIVFNENATKLDSSGSSAKRDLSSELVDLSDSALSNSLSETTFEPKAESKTVAPQKSALDQANDDLMALEAAKNYKITPQPKYWRVMPLLISFRDARAEGSCSQESGQQGGQALMAIAMMMAGLSPAIAAAVQANADKQIAKTNADAQIKMAGISADTSKYLAEQQSQVALQQAETSKQIAAANQQGTTQRLNMQLAELGRARDQANQLEEKKRQYQAQLDGQRMQLAQYQADQTIKLANMQFRAQLSAAGLSQGLSRTVNSAGQLSFANRGPLLPNGQLNPANANGLAANQMGLASVGSALAQQGASLPMQQAGGIQQAGLGQNTAGMLGVARGATNRLLASAGVDSGASEDGEWVIENGKKVFKRKPGTLARGVALSTGALTSGRTNVTASATLKSTMGSMRGIIGGSTPQSAVRTVSGSDLENYANRAVPQKRGFVDYYASERNAPVVNLPANIEPAAGHGRGVSGAYNSDGLEEDSGVRRAYRGVGRPSTLK